MDIAVLQSWASLIVLPDIGCSLTAIGMDATQHTGLSKTECWGHTDPHLALCAYGEERLKLCTQRKHQQWYCIAAENDDRSNYVDDEEIQREKKRPYQSTPLLAPSSINFIFSPSKVTLRQCQCTAEINITNISHKPAQKRFFRGSFKSNAWMRKISLWLWRKGGRHVL